MQGQKDQEDINKLVDGLKVKLNKLMEEEYKKENRPIEIPPEASLLIRNSKNINSPKAYQDIINKQKQMQFRKRGNIEQFTSNDTPDHLLGDTDDGSQINLLEDLNLGCYQRPWGKLEHELKINRAMHFVKREILKNKLDESESKKLRVLLVGAINKRLITKKTNVNYNETTGQLEEIYYLHFDTIKREYSFSDYDSKESNTIKSSMTIEKDDNTSKYIPPKKGQNGYVSHVSKLSPAQNREFKKAMMGEISEMTPITQKPTIIKKKL